MKLAKTLLIGTIAALFSTPLLAATAPAPAPTAASVKDMPDGSPVTLSGTVEDFDSAHAFYLRDSSDFIKVDLSSAKSMVLKDGEKVTVTGAVNQTILGADVVASTVSEDKGVGERVGAAIDSVTGQDAAGSAQAVSIQALPKTGLIKIVGTVDSVDSEKKFTVKDSTGHVDVTIRSSESASLNKGAHITVIGYVNNGLLGKSINATKVDVRSDSASVTK